MALLTKAPRGTQDILPAESHRWQYVENTLLRTAELFGFKEIRFPTFEHTELFQRSVGDTTDVVQKEMYTFTDKGDRSITLRPEGTAGTVRAVMEHGLLGEALPLRTSYITSCFRYEKPQAGRLREFHQFGAEVFGSSSPSADAELIAMAAEALAAVGLPAESLTLEINSIGCPHCRPKYHAALKAYFEEHREKLCPTCLDRLEKNPLRILDCKSPICGEIAQGAPVVLDYLCEECADHFAGLKARLDALCIPYAVNPRIVRGLDYYTKTVFEFVSEQIGAQGTVCGGGRYDGLVEELGGQPTPALGFGMGIERLLLVLQAAGAEMPDPVTCDIYFANMGEAAALKAFELCGSLRQSGFYAECDVMGRSLKAQMKYANKIGARYSMVLGDSEIESGRANLKNMATGEQTEVDIGDDFADIIYDMMANAAYNEL